MSKNCHNCKFNIVEREHVRLGEQVRCAVAEERFGGERWVNVRKSEKTGKLLNAKCGAWEHFLGDELLPPAPEKKGLKTPCKRCSGSGNVKVRVMDKDRQLACPVCKGEGKAIQ